MQYLDILINIIPIFSPPFLAVQLLPDKTTTPYWAFFANEVQERQNEEVALSALTYISSQKEKDVKKQTELKLFDNGYKPGAKGLKRIKGLCVQKKGLCVQNKADLKY